jgi:hypothetical protein
MHSCLRDAGQRLLKFTGEFATLGLAWPVNVHAQSPACSYRFKLSERYFHIESACCAGTFSSVSKHSLQLLERQFHVDYRATTVLSVRKGDQVSILQGRELRPNKNHVDTTLLSANVGCHHGRWSSDQEFRDTETQREQNEKHV